jgi:hypothetical protein
LKEAWLPIPGTSGWYDVSNFGEIRSWIKQRWDHSRERAENPRIMRQQSHNGNVTIQIAGKTIRVKDAVCDVFLGGKREGMILRHKDGNYQNCAVNNLEFVTRADFNKERRSPNCRIVAKTDKWGKVLKFYPSARAAARENYLSTSGLHRRIKNKSFIDGVIFKYAD